MNIVRKGKKTKSIITVSINGIPADEYLQNMVNHLEGTGEGATEEMMETISSAIKLELGRAVIDVQTTSLNPILDGFQKYVGRKFYDVRLSSEDLFECKKVGILGGAATVEFISKNGQRSVIWLGDCIWEEIEDGEE